MARAIFKAVLGTLVTSIAVIGTTARMAVAQIGFVGDYAPEQWQLYNSSPAFPDIDNSQLSIGGVPLAPFNGSVDFADAPDTLTLFGSDQSAILDNFGLGCSSPELPVTVLFLCDSSFTALFVTVQQDSEVSFDWDYSTTDSLGPAFDPFGYVVSNFPPDDLLNADGSFIELIDREGGAQQSGTVGIDTVSPSSVEPISVNANQIFAFQIGTADNQGGRSSVTIRNFQVAVKESDSFEPTSVPEPVSGLAIAAITGLALGMSKRSKT